MLVGLVATGALVTGWASQNVIVQLDNPPAYSPAASFAAHREPSTVT